jgi:hypothetical protein
MYRTALLAAEASAAPHPRRSAPYPLISAKKKHNHGGHHQLILTFIRRFNVGWASIQTAPGVSMLVDPLFVIAPADLAECFRCWLSVVLRLWIQGVPARTQATQKTHRATSFACSDDCIHHTLLHPPRCRSKQANASVCIAALRRHKQHPATFLWCSQTSGSSL